MKFFKIPNLDLNDRFLVSSNDFINKDYEKIKKFIDKYEYKNNVIIYSSYKNNKYIYELYTIKDDSLFLFDKYSSQDLIYNNYFNDLNARLINFWRSSSAFCPIHCILISVPFEAASVIRPNKDEPLTVFLPFFTKNFDLHLEVKSTNFADALA